MKHRTPELQFETSDGLAVEVFRVQAEDVDYLIDLFEHLSTNSRYLRFNQYLSSVDPGIVRREAELIATADPAVSAGWLAFADLPEQPHAPMAGARFVITDDPTRAEVSVSVRDDMQHHGIGAQMLLFLASEARKRGIHTLYGTFQTSNRRIWSLLAESPYQSTTLIDGFQTTVSIDLQSTRQATREKTDAQPDGLDAR